MTLRSLAEVGKKRVQESIHSLFRPINSLQLVVSSWHTGWESGEGSELRWEPAGRFRKVKSWTVRSWGLEGEGTETQRGLLGASGALRTNKEARELHWARNLRRESGKRANKLDNQERGRCTGLNLERGEKLCQGREGGARNPKKRL